MSLLRRFKKETNGAALLELTLVLPLVLLIGMGTIEFGNLLQKRQLIINGVRDATRYVAGLGYDPTNPTANVAAGQNMATRGTATGGTNRVAWWNPAAVTFSYTAIPMSSNCGVGGNEKCYRPEGDFYTVTATTSVTYTELGALGFLHNMGAIASPTITLTATHQERVFSVR